MDRAEFSFDFGEGASTIYHALLPETLEEFPRSRAALSVDGGVLHIIVDAEDVTALRAALNTWLRLIKVACEMVEIRHGLGDIV
ncbi:MAG: KEOPS complex subunit Pcc1 [Candidatus Methanogasteraceae archaeon]